MSGRLLVVGVGNRDRGDDAVGPTVCDRLDRTGDPAIATCVVETGGTELLHAWSAADDVIIVDAAAPAGRPGHVTRLDAMDVVTAGPSTLSTHAVDVSAWLELGRIVGMLPAQLRVIAIEGRAFDLGDPLSEHVDRAADEVVRLIRAIAHGPMRPSALPRSR